MAEPDRAFGSTGRQPSSHGQNDDWLNLLSLAGGVKDKAGQPSTDTEEEAKRFIVALTRKPDRPGSGRRNGGRTDCPTRSVRRVWLPGLWVESFTVCGSSPAVLPHYPARLLAWMWLNNAARENSVH